MAELIFLLFVGLALGLGIVILREIRERRRLGRMALEIRQRGNRQ